jgi:pimeloyl-ACP methyl ester carboxylesterase
MQRFLALTLLLWVSVCVAASAQELPVALTTDPPPDRNHPATMVTMQIPSNGSQLNAMMYIAAGAGPHPAVILLHGFPGNERNLDLAQAMRRAGWNVLYFNYRGSWGSPGAFSFTHSLEDTAAAIDFLRDRSNAAELRTDPARIVLIGHSLGGFIAAYAAAHDGPVLGIGLISAANLGGMSSAQGPESVAVPRLSATFTREGMEPLSGCTAESLARETVTHRAQWNFNDYASVLAAQPVLIVTSDDGLAGHGRVFAEALHGKGSTLVTEKHFATDHSYSADRLALEATVLNWLAALPQKPKSNRPHNTIPSSHANQSNSTVATLMKPIH